MKRVLLASLVVLVVVVVARRADACSCLVPGQGEVWSCRASRSAAAIFVGTVIEQQRDGFAVRTTFHVSRSFRGPAEGGRIVLDGRGSSCDIHFQLGRVYFVYAQAGPARGRLSAEDCGGTRPIEWAAADLAFAARAKPVDGLLLGTVLRWERTSPDAYRATPGFSGVAVTITGAGVQRTVVTGADGGFRVDDLAPGSYRISAAIPPPFRSEGDRVVEVVAAGCGVAVALVADPLGALSGQVLDEARRPRSGVTVAALPVDAAGVPDWDRPPGGELTGTTDAAGRFAIPWVAAGTYRLAVRHQDQPLLPGAWPYPDWRGRKDVVVAPSARVAVADIPLPAPFVAVALDVRVVWPDGKPAVGAYVTAVMDERGWQGDAQPTDAAARASLPVYRDHAYRVYADWDDGKRQRRARPVHVKISASRQAVRLVLSEDGTSRYD